MEVNQEKSWFPGIKFNNGYVREESPNQNLKDLDNSWNRNCETGDSHICTDGKVEKVSEDIVDLLPKDPFGMDITFTTFTRWIEDFDLKDLGFESGEDEDENVDDQLVAKVDIVLNSANGFHPDMGDNGACDGRVLMDESSEGSNCGQEYTKNYAVGPPSYALFLALAGGFLGVWDLLAVERVCKSLRDAVQSDPLLWRNFHIDYPLSHKITDDALLLLANRADGQLQSLSLVDCLKITDHGLRKVLESNPGLTKLNVVGCLKLSVEGIIDNLRFLKLVGKPGIKYLRIGGTFSITTQQFEELKFLLGIQNQKPQQITRKPRFIREGQLSLSLDDEREIDIEICPRCQRVRQIYDCTADGCKGKLHTMQACRACTLCISRCRNCGRCLINCDYEETFGLELICLDCCKEILSRQEVQTRMTILLYG